MFLTRKSLTKIRLLTGAYLALSTLCFLISILFAILEIEYLNMVIVGAVCLVLARISYRFGRYAEGKGKLITKGNELIMKQLRPEEFVRLCEEKAKDPTNVISKPDCDVLQLLLTAYDAMGRSDLALETVEQMLAVAPQKKLNIIKLLKCALLFDVGRSAEAEDIYRIVTAEKLDFMAKALADVVMKTSRALFLGDSITAENYFRLSLNQKFPKPTPLSTLSAHYHLARICHMTDRVEEAEEHRRYCIENGGETGMHREAVSGDIFQIS